jgi:hypothetical protein
MSLNKTAWVTGIFRNIVVYALVAQTQSADLVKTDFIRQADLLVFVVW